LIPALLVEREVGNGLEDACSQGIVLCLEAESNVVLDARQKPNGGNLLIFLTHLRKRIDCDPLELSVRGS
jgi:hypothetical protein